MAIAVAYNVLVFFSYHFRRCQRYISRVESRVSNVLHRTQDRELLKMVVSKDFAAARKLVLSAGSCRGMRQNEDRCRN